MSDSVRLAVKSRTLVWLALGTSVLAGCSVKSSGLGAAKPAGTGGKSGGASRPDAGSAETTAPPIDGAEGDSVPTMAFDAGGFDLASGAGGAVAWDGGQVADGPPGMDRSVGAGGALGTGGVRISDGSVGAGGMQGTGGAMVPDGALASGGNRGTGGVSSLGGVPGTGGAGGGRSDAEVGTPPDAADLPGADAAADADPDLGFDAAPDHGEPDLAEADLALDLRDARDTRVIGDSRRDAARADGSSMRLVWSDEFNAPANTGVDSAKWNYITWLPGQVNDEKQRYTSSLDNVFHDGDGHLVLRALYSPSALYPFTSGRIDTNQKVSFGPGHHVEVRAKLPAGAGSFPGIIMMGTSGSWPNCGQLSLMEQYGQDKSVVYSTVHAGDAPGSGSTDNEPYVFPDATTASADFHVYSLDWYSDRVVFRVDGDEFLSSIYATTSPLYNITEYFVLDVALGGDMGGVIDKDAFPMDMVIDYVRVYEL